MPQISFDVTDSGTTKVIDGIVEPIYHIVITGAMTLDVLLAVPEINWRIAQLSDRIGRFKAKIAEKTNRLNPVDVTADRAEVIAQRRLFEVAKFSRLLTPGGGLV